MSTSIRHDPVAVAEPYRGNTRTAWRQHRGREPTLEAQTLSPLHCRPANVRCPSLRALSIGRLPVLASREVWMCVAAQPAPNSSNSEPARRARRRAGTGGVRR